MRRPCEPLVLAYTQPHTAAGAENHLGMKGKLRLAWLALAVAVAFGFGWKIEQAPWK